MFDIDLPASMSLADLQRERRRVAHLVELSKPIAEYVRQLGLPPGGMPETVLGVLPAGQGRGTANDVLCRQLEASLATARWQRSAKQCRRIAPRQYQVGDAPPLTVTIPQDEVVKALIELGGSAELGQLRVQSTVDDANKQLKKLVKSHPELRPFITLPGGKGRGGYRTSITK